MLFWSLVVSPFHGVRVAFSSRTVPQGSQVTQKFLPLKIASLAILAALLVAVASVFFFCFARPPLFPQSENRKMFLTTKKFYKNILERQKSHPAIEAEWLRKIFLLLRSHVFLKLSAQGDQKAINLRKRARKPLQSSIYASSLLSGEAEKSVQTATASGSFFCDLLQVFHEYHRHSHAFCPFLYKTTLSIRSLIFCSPFPVIIYPSLLINRGLKAVCTLDRNKKYISHKQVNGFYKPNSSISFFTSSFFSSEMLRLSLISSIARFLPPQNIILHHLRT